MTYALYNKANEQKLTHPVNGLWSTTSLEEAKSMLATCQQYVEELGLDKEDFVIIDAETDDIVHRE